MKIPRFFFFLIFPAAAAAIFRPYDIYRPGPRGVGAGGTGTANIDSIGDLPSNPAYLAEMTSSSVALAIDAQTRVTRVQTNVQFKPQFFPVLSWGMPILPNAGIGIMAYSPFQRHFLDENFLYYNFEAAFAYAIHRHIALGVSAGVGMGLQAERFTGWGASGSASLLVRHPLLDGGLLFRPGTRLQYDPYATGSTVEERFPDTVKGGVSRKFGRVTVTMEATWLNWDAVSFVENGRESAPAFENNYLGRVNLHAGCAFTLPWYEGLFFRTGLLTEDFYDAKGTNDKQVLLAIGLGGLAGDDVWGERLRLDVSLLSSFIPSLVSASNHQIEKIQGSFEFIY